MTEDGYTHRPFDRHETPKWAQVLIFVAILAYVTGIAFLIKFVLTLF